MHFKVVFHLDGTGVYMDEPIHLDALLGYALAPMQRVCMDISREDTPDDIQLPLLRSKVNGYKVWHASAIFPDGADFESLRHWRKRFRRSRAELTKGSPNLKMGVYRDYNVPIPLILAPRMIGYASGNRKSVKKILKKNIRALGKKRAYGYGRIVDIDLEETPEDWSFIKDGIAMRWLPHADGTRIVRPAPPYWNTVGRVKCCEVGDEF